MNYAQKADVRCPITPSKKDESDMKGRSDTPKIKSARKKPVFSDETIIAKFPWKDWKSAAMRTGYHMTFWFVSAFISHTHYLIKFI